MADYPKKLAAFLDLLGMTSDRTERIQALIDIASRFERVPERIAREPYPAEHLTPACESEAYVFAEPEPGGTLRFHFAVQNPQGISAKALAVILGESLSGERPEDILRVPGEIIYDIFGRELSMGKSMGLMGMVSMLHRFAKEQIEARGAARDGDRISR